MNKIPIIAGNPINNDHLLFFRITTNADKYLFRITTNGDNSLLFSRTSTNANNHFFRITTNADKYLFRIIINYSKIGKGSL